jgi:hypothetical protein
MGPKGGKGGGGGLYSQVGRRSPAEGEAKRLKGKDEFPPF